MAFNIQGGAHCCSFEYDWTLLLCFYADDGSISIVGTRSLGGRSISKLTPPRSLAEMFFGMARDIHSGGSSWLLSLMPPVLLGYGHVACADTTMALLPSLWLSYSGGAFKTFEDVLLSIRSITTDMGVEAGIPSIDNVLSHCRKAPFFRHVSSVLPIVVTVHVHDGHHLWAGVIKCGFEAHECWPSTLKKLKDLCTFFRWRDCRDVCSSYLDLNGKSTEVLKAFTASLAQ